MDEARLVDTDAGKVPEGEGWFAVNLRDVAWWTLERGGTWTSFEADGVPNQIGVGAHVLPEGHSTGAYHREGNQEGFLVLEGRCLVIVEGEERVLGQWDYFHCPPGTAHIMVGGEGGCVLFMFGNRLPGAQTDYLPDPVAARHGVAVEEHTTSSKVAYADWPRDYTRVPSPWPPRVGR